VLEPKTPAPAMAVAETPAPAMLSPREGASVQATSRGFPAQFSPPVESQPRTARPAEVHGEVPVPSKPRENEKKGSPAVLVVIGLIALGVGVGGGVLLFQRAKAKPTATAPALVPNPVETTAAQNPEPLAKVPAASTEQAPGGDVAATAPSAPAPSVTPEAAPSASAAPEASAAPVAPGPPPAVPPPSFDLEKIPGDRAALLVHSSAAARVFVHGRDYGETNQYLLTSCGIRFVRIGRGFNDFLEPGRSLVVKCGRVTEVTVEPDR
jgi:hypothetical protein